MNWPVILAFTKPVLAFAGDAAWPVAAIAIAFRFKEPIAGIIGRVRRVSGFGVEAEIPPNANQIAGNSAPDAGILSTTTGELSVPPLPPADQLLDPVEQRLRTMLDAEPLNDNQKLRWAIRVAIIWQVLAWHERTYRQIYGSQIAFLKHLNVVGRITRSAAYEFFQNSRAQVELPHYNAERWLQYLLDDERVASVEGPGDQLELTIGGRAFLTWMAGNGVIETKPF
ncbi:hypothetical protein [uncultured Sphingomonas sp.]|uniref:hypothetical protein n=1 Tax=uncultured Sphingomonas sp. TaxID=158754 RepID=UPI0025F8F29F|nr:hypothetical protein [uncultured Sphingomonas sp.]